MFENLDTAFAATLAERDLAEMRASRLGPLFVEEQRRARKRTADRAPFGGTIRRLAGQARSALNRTSADRDELRPAAGQ